MTQLVVWLGGLGCLGEGQLGCGAPHFPTLRGIGARVSQPNLGAEGATGILSLGQLAVSGNGKSGVGLTWPLGSGPVLRRHD